MTLMVKNIYKKYKKKYVVNNVTFHLNPGEIVGLIGPNGAGKTTSFYMIVGLIKPYRGKIILNEEDITNYPIHQRSRKGIGYLAQEPSIFRKLSVEDNILCILEMQEKIDQKENKNKMEQLMEEFGLQDIRKNRGDILSGGERKRTEIARCLAINPKFILLDEPFSGIDPIAMEELQRIILSLKKKNIGILITDHNVQEIFSITDRLYLMVEGKILKEVYSQEELRQDSMVRKVYLGNK
ncbi:MAG: LPS export ABC transporter ATP-binding protein [Flavobacteriales bacterium]|jgi:lipopolysaccharide export system ATP-binding protein|uniref:LPS export ABC transporter ATP-binding protein n=1 Tax=Blattabacterium sp. (Mastotermes darwiniensis) TaxID=39768 RepID=UPI000231DF3F|nr:LPS export ABC transporter ATP-binding protein [Blattabacterium sp. (Mastotermes darwiniensis)]AER40348.1 ABC transporter, ATP-binding protein [Blattabacterium sp. (Mastotermes darwiniensis) str. MADAR]MDR1804931.1 LPS export ABC transporter ATP-binding protein [Flavobacteriales bacterium]